MQTEGHHLLKDFVGSWKTRGWVKGKFGNPDIQISGTDIYEWLPGGFVLLHTIDVLIGQEHKQGLEVIGYDASTHTFPMHYFDEQGNAETMQASLKNEVWRFEGPSIRFAGSFSNEGKELSGIWEQKKEDLEWSVLMEILLEKVT